jgi:hypothetical protein
VVSVESSGVEWPVMRVFSRFGGEVARLRRRAAGRGRVAARRGLFGGCAEWVDAPSRSAAGCWLFKVQRLAKQGGVHVTTGFKRDIARA